MQYESSFIVGAPICETGFALFEEASTLSAFPSDRSSIKDKVGYEQWRTHKFFSVGGFNKFS